MRGYQALRRISDTDKVERLGIALEQTELLPTGVDLSPLISQSVELPSERVLRQYLVLRLLRSYVFPELLRCLGSRKPRRFRSPIPRPWRATLRRQGVAIDGVSCALLWQGYLVILLGYALLEVIRTTQSNRKQRGITLQGAAYFHGLSAPQTPQSNTQGPSRDLLTNLSNRDLFPETVTWLAHSAVMPTPVGLQDMPETGCKRPVGRVLLPWAAAATSWVMLRSLATYTVLAAASVIWAVRGQWWNSTLVHEATLLSQFQAAPPSGRASVYLFHNSGWIFRPLWTYEATRSGSEIVLYLYSSNVAGKDSLGKTMLNNQWGLCTWPTYWVWDTTMANFIQTRTGANDSQIITTGPFEFSDEAGEMPDLDRPAVALFDVQPVRPAIYAKLALGFDYYTSSTSLAFLKQAVSAAEASGRTVLFKRKRGHGGKFVDRRYLAEVEHLVGSGRMIAASPGLAASRVIERADAVISMPYTSTSVIAQSMGKPACFFDPVGLLAKDDKDARGLPILQTQTELEEWLRDVLGDAPADTKGRGLA